MAGREMWEQISCPQQSEERRSHAGYTADGEDRRDGGRKQRTPLWDGETEKRNIGGEEEERLREREREDDEGEDRERISQIIDG